MVKSENTVPIQELQQPHTQPVIFQVPEEMGTGVGDGELCNCLYNGEKQGDIIEASRNKEGPRRWLLSFH